MNSLIFSVCMLFQVSDDTVRGSATGFFYTNSDQLYLITNRHVVAYSENDTTAKLGFNLHTSTDNMRLIKAIEIPLNLNGRMTWYGYSDTSIDVVAIPLKKEAVENCVIEPFSAGNFPPEELKISIGDELLAIGYPHGFTDTKHYTPIVKTCIVSTPVEIPFEGKPMVVIEGNLQPGMSGSPIITKPTSVLSVNGALMYNPNPQFYFIGIHSASFMKNSGVKSEPVYSIEDGKIQITHFKKVPIDANLGLQTCWTNGVIQNLVEQIH